MSAPSLVAEGVGYVTRGKALVRDVSLALHPGRLVVIAGPNGAGKSTLLKLLTGELAPTSGHVTIGGDPVTTLAPWRLACRRAVMAQASRLAFPFTAHEVVSIGASGVGRAMTASAQRQGVSAALRAADVLHLAGRDYQTLSGGEQQRVQFARALAQLSAGAAIEPAQVLFLDEPVSSLDLKHQLALLDAAREVARGGAAVLAVLHDLNLAFAYADELIVMHGGRAHASGAPDAIVTDALLREVFEVDLRLCAPAPGGQPWLLPQSRGTAP